MKEKIGIEKLYELLFDYSRNKGYYWTLRQSGKIEGDVRGTDHTLEDEEVSMVIKSKEFGFIKWLVENEKIEYRKIIEKEIEVGFKLVRIKDYPNKIMEEDVEELLMLLSIQDEPINFLISILK